VTAPVSPAPAGQPAGQVDANAVITHLGAEISRLTVDLAIATARAIGAEQRAAAAEARLAQADQQAHADQLPVAGP
jgi:hypothetical protein